MNILIVDDDTVIRKWLSILLEKAELFNSNYNIFEASDGIEAYEVCSKEPIDLVITDIKMPQMNGIDLIKKLKKEKPSIRTVILSSYDDFEYVRTALKAGALDYILKAEMTIEDITNVLNKVANNIKLENLMANTSRNEVYSASLYEQKRLFENYLKNPSSGKFSFLDPDNPENAIDNLCIALFRLESEINPSSLLDIFSICDNVLKSENLQGTCIPWKDKFFILVYKCSSLVSEYQDEKFLKLSELINQDIEKFIFLSLSFSINVFCKKGNSFIDAFTKANDIVTKHEYYRGRPLPDTQDNDVSEGKLAAMIRLITRSLDKKNYSDAFANLKKYIAESHDMAVSPDTIKKNCRIVLYTLLSHALLMDNENKSLMKFDNFFNRLNRVKTDSELEEWADQLENNFMECLRSVYKKLSPAIKKAIDFIDENYSEKITLSMVANKVFLNKTYLSQLFKKELGTNFHHYLKTVRIKKALQLIQTTDKSLTEISKCVGFSNQNYFTKVFKKVVGEKPSTYKKSFFSGA